MNLKRKTGVFFAILVLSFSFSCKKEVIEGQTISNNDSPYYDGIPTVLVQNYINRVFIDLIGREPLDLEMDYEVNKLVESNYSLRSRDSLITKLMKNQSFIEGDSSYKAAAAPAALINLRLFISRRGIRSTRKKRNKQVQELHWD